MSQQPISPKRRVFRTTVQVIVGVAAAIPTAVVLLPVSAAVAAAVCGFAGAAAIIASAVQNAVEQSRSDEG